MTSFWSRQATTAGAPEEHDLEGEHGHGAVRLFRAAGGWLLAYVLLAIVTVAIGLFLVQVGQGDVGTTDDKVARWFADQRTPRWNDLGQVGSGLADAYVLTPAVLFLAVAFVVRFRRGTETFLLIGATSVVVASRLLASPTLAPSGPGPMAATPGVRLARAST